MLWKILIGAVAVLLGYWTWFDRRFYSYGAFASAVWALGVAAGVYGALWATVSAARLLLP